MAAIPMSKAHLTSIGGEHTDGVGVWCKNVGTTNRHAEYGAVGYPYSQPLALTTLGHVRPAQ